MASSEWRVSGSYFEACNCDAICPCRRQGGEKLTTGSTYGVCSFALSWKIVDGAFGSISLSGRSAVLAGSYRDDEPGKPWRVFLYVDDHATVEQWQAIADIFTGRAGGYVVVRGATPVKAEHGAVSCGIPGHDHPGEEVRTGLMRVDDPPLGWEVAGRCGFATDFAYSSDS